MDETIEKFTCRQAFASVLYYTRTKRPEGMKQKQATAFFWVYELLGIGVGGNMSSLLLLYVSSRPERGA